ncbi:10208_t:CDS:2 [Paraglomus occultum]|uniref:10208_t:CDS:1 n=1 Tax=Paraglomus occultum TaxID=144539 RepID=A0A9N9CKY0_9GLOM|nr:10208_t:CDS:2 [Paraglomus occultum]
MITGLLIWRVAVRGHRLIAKDPMGEMGILRPRPLEGFLLLSMFHVAGRLLYSVCLLSDFLPNYAIKEFFHDVTFTISLAGIGIYLIGLIYTIPRSYTFQRRLNSYTITPNDHQRFVWIPRPAVVDTFGFLILLGPVVSLNTFAILTGVYYDRNDAATAEKWLTVHYLAWSFFCWILILGLLYVGKQLTTIIVRHIEETKDSGTASDSKVRSLALGLKKLRYVLNLVLSTLLFFAIVSLLFALFRQYILTHNIMLSYFIATCWVFIVPIVTVIVITVLAIEINEKERVRVHILRQSSLAGTVEGEPMARTGAYKSKDRKGFQRSGSISFTKAEELSTIGSGGSIAVGVGEVDADDVESVVASPVLLATHTNTIPGVESSKYNDQQDGSNLGDIALQPLSNSYTPNYKRTTRY